jgi:hypothetical protein
MAILLMVIPQSFSMGKMGHLCSQLVLAVLNFYNVTLQRYFSHPSLVIPTSLIRLKLGLQIGGGKRTGRLLIANHLDQSLWLPNLEQGAAVRSYLLHSSLAGVRLDCVFYQPQQANCTKMLGQAHSAELNRHVLTFLHPILLCRVICYWALGGFDQPMYSPTLTSPH